MKPDVKIKSKIDLRRRGSSFYLAGWLSTNDRSYLWFGDKDGCLGILEGQKLRRLCAAILKRRPVLRRNRPRRTTRRLDPSEHLRSFGMDE